VVSFYYAEAEATTHLADNGMAIPDAQKFIAFETMFGHNHAVMRCKTLFKYAHTTDSFKTWANFKHSLCCTPSISPLMKVLRVQKYTRKQTQQQHIPCLF
jgi:hypothetical protein